MRFVTIGFAHAHIDAAVSGFRQLPGVELVGIADSDAQRLADRQAKLGVPAYADYRAMLDALRPDFAAVCPANADKAAVIVECAARGVHVFADKPLVTRRPHLEQVERAVQASGIEVWAYLELRYYAPLVEIKRRIDAGQIGEVVSVYATGPHKLSLPSRTPEMLDAERNGGVLVDLGCHDVDLARWFTGREPLEVTAYLSKRRFLQLDNFWDTAQALYRFAGEVSVYIEPSWLQPDASAFWGDSRVMVVGTLGTLEYRTCDQSVTLVTVERGEEPVTPEPAPVSILEDFVATLRGHGSGTLTTAETLATMRAIITAHEAALAGRTLPCAPPHRP
ncbi:MAG: Gfo/Idh/MocA family oxidoreductase [Armatimonadetes bacterium]|nr:Gfo/Idh/MocA family oxidoreductase [Armatimonadota bacterium]